MDEATWSRKTINKCIWRRPGDITIYKSPTIKVTTMAMVAGVSSDGFEGYFLSEKSIDQFTSLKPLKHILFGCLIP